MKKNSIRRETTRRRPSDDDCVAAAMGQGRKYQWGKARIRADRGGRTVGCMRRDSSNGSDPKKVLLEAGGGELQKALA
jgi:hypothetical protein